MAEEHSTHDAMTTDRGLCIHEHFERQVQRAPDVDALLHNDDRVSYRALNAMANHWARVLVERGVGPETWVGVTGQRSPELVAALFGILKAGAGYLPLDSTFPAARLAKILAAARVRVVLRTGGADNVDWLAGYESVDVGDQPPVNETENLVGRAKLDNVALAVFTSGSLAEPKGIVLTHRALNIRLQPRAAGQDRNASQSTTFCQKARLSVVAHVSDLLMPLLWGGTSVIFDDETVMNGVKFAESIKRHAITFFLTVPTHLCVLLESDRAVQALTDVKVIGLSGDEPTPTLIRAVRTRLPNVTLLNAYGSSETAGLVAIARMTDTHRVNVGTATPVVRCYIVDSDMTELPSGATGELCVAGEQIARGYLRQPGLTAEHFAPNPFGPHGSRMYRTGDLARRSADGRIEIVGRVNLEIKVKGFRVNLAEVEQTLEMHPAVQRAVVMLDQAREGFDRLIAHIQPTPHTGHRETDDVRAFIRSQLPDYMVPVAYHWHDQFPILRTGKIDRVQLGQTTAGPSDAGAAASNPNDDTLTLVLGIWRDALGNDAVGMSDDFFDVGGDSLAGMRILSGLANECGVELALEELFSYGTAENVAKAIDRMKMLTRGTASTP